MSASTPTLGTAGASAPSADPGWAVLWDLDNFDPGPRRTEQVGQALARLAGPQAALVVSAHPHRLRLSAAALRGCGFQIIKAKATKNAADRRLIQAGWTLRREGVQSFLIVSSDHAFAGLARRVTAVVLAQRSETVSRRLGLAAVAVLPLDPDLA